MAAAATDEAGAGENDLGGQSCESGTVVAVLNYCEKEEMEP